MKNIIKYCDYCPNYLHEFKRHKLIYEEEMNKYLNIVDNYENKINKNINKIEYLLKLLKIWLKHLKLINQLKLNLKKN